MGAREKPTHLVAALWGYRLDLLLGLVAAFFFALPTLSRFSFLSGMQFSSATGWGWVCAFAMLGSPLFLFFLAWVRGEERFWAGGACAFLLLTLVSYETVVFFGVFCFIPSLLFLYAAEHEKRRLSSRKRLRRPPLPSFEVHLGSAWVLYGVGLVFWFVHVSNFFQLPQIWAASSAMMRHEHLSCFSAAAVSLFWLAVLWSHIKLLQLLCVSFTSVSPPRFSIERWSVPPLFYTAFALLVLCSVVLPGMARSLCISAALVLSLVFLLDGFLNLKCLCSYLRIPFLFYPLKWGALFSLAPLTFSHAMSWEKMFFLTPIVSILGLGLLEPFVGLRNKLKVRKR